jgi:hypothetical protein
MVPTMDGLTVFCADVGSVKNGNFSWARGASEEGPVLEHDSSSPEHLADAVADELHAGHPVALGFECPLFVPVPAAALALGAARIGEGNRAWSAGAGTGALATGLVQAAWVLAAIKTRCPDGRLHLTWPAFAAEQRGLLLWEAFVTAEAKGATHFDDATIAVEAFIAALPDPTSSSTITAERPLSLAGAVGLWSGWLQDPRALHDSPLVIRA